MARQHEYIGLVKIRGQRTEDREEQMQRSWGRSNLGMFGMNRKKLLTCKMRVMTVTAPHCIVFWIK